MPWLSWIISNVVLASLLALSAWFVQRQLGRPGLARILWVLVLVKLVTPPLISVPLGESAGTWACILGTCRCGQHAAWQAWAPVAVPWAVLAAWSVGAVATLVAGWRRWRRFERLLAHAQAAPESWQHLTARHAADISLRGPPEILFVPGRLPPLVVPGIRGPRVLVPEDLVARLDAAQQSALVLHEVVHIKRGDHWVRLLEFAVGVVYWWLPLVGLIGRRLRTCEEASCDAAVVARLPHARREYAQLLLDVVDFTHPLPKTALRPATAMSAADDLERRLRTILHAAQRPRRVWPVGAAAVGLACAILPCGLRYDFAAPDATAGPAAVISGDLGPAAATWPGGNRSSALLIVCCPD